LGEVPVMGALFRSTEFQTDQTELMFVVTPRLVKPLTTAVTLPTDNHIVPTRGQIMLMGTGEGAAPAPVLRSSIEATPLAAQGPAPAPARAVEAAPSAASAGPVRASSVEAAPLAATPAPAAR
jgi:pilus assembly protein CpaC